MPDLLAYNLKYWRRNAPSIVLRYDKNTHLDKETFFFPWYEIEDASPIVYATVTPRQKPIGSAGPLADPTTAEGISAVMSLMPGPGGAIGQVLSTALQAGVGFATSYYAAQEAADWQSELMARKPSDFAPSIVPRPFDVPLPLSYAQVAVSRPWLFPALVDVFQAQMHAGEFIPLEEIYYDLTGEKFSSLPIVGNTNLTEQFKLDSFQSTKKAPVTKLKTNWLIPALVGGLFLISK